MLNVDDLLAYPTCCPLVRFSHIAKGASKMLRATGHARMVTFWPALSALTMLVHGPSRAASLIKSEPFSRAARAACASTWLDEVRSKMLCATGGHACMVKLSRNERTWTVCWMINALALLQEIMKEARIALTRGLCHLRAPRARPSEVDEKRKFKVI